MKEWSAVDLNTKKIEKCIICGKKILELPRNKKIKVCGSICRQKYQKLYYKKLFDTNSRLCEKKNDNTAEQEKIERLKGRNIIKAIKWRDKNKEQWKTYMREFMRKIRMKPKQKHSQKSI